MSDYPDVPSQVRKQLKNLLFVFDFDGTLVPQTRYTNDADNIIQFMGFQFAINPSAYRVKWTIATSRPIQDGDLIYNSLRSNNVNTSFPIMLQTTKVPKVGNDEEVQFKLQCLQYCKKHYNEHVVYVDNNDQLRDKIAKADPSIICCNVIDFIIMNQHKITEVFDYE